MTKGSRGRGSKGSRGRGKRTAPAAVKAVQDHHAMPLNDLLKRKQGCFRVLGTHVFREVETRRLLEARNFLHRSWGAGGFQLV